MKVVVDMQKLDNLYSGLGQFCLNLGKELIKESDTDFLFLGKNEIPFASQVNFFQPGLIGKITGKSAVKADVWHCTHQEPKILPDKKVKLILTIHDLNFLYKYKSDWRKNLKIGKLQKLINRSDAIVTVSHFTLNEIQNNFFIPDIITRVIYNGVSLNKKLNSVKPAFAPTEHFLFSLGIISSKKNFHVLIPFLKKTKYKLVIAGDNSTSYAKEIMKSANESEVRDKVILPGKISEEEKLWLYRNCEAFVFPSLAEGFGLPVAEAMSQGKPVFLSDKTSLPEIGGDAAFYWENFEPEYMFNIFNEKMHLYKHDISYKEKLINQSKKFSWEYAARQYFDLYCVLADKKDKRY